MVELKLLSMIRSLSVMLYLIVHAASGKDRNTVQRS